MEGVERVGDGVGGQNCHRMDGLLPSEAAGAFSGNGSTVPHRLCAWPPVPAALRPLPAVPRGHSQGQHLLRAVFSLVYVFLQGSHPRLSLLPAQLPLSPLSSQRLSVVCHLPRLSLLVLTPAFHLPAGCASISVRHALSPLPSLLRHPHVSPPCVTAVLWSPPSLLTTLLSPHLMVAESRDRCLFNASGTHPSPLFIPHLSTAHPLGATLFACHTSPIWCS